MKKFYLTGFYNEMQKIANIPLNDDREINVERVGAVLGAGSMATAGYNNAIKFFAKKMKTTPEIVKDSLFNTQNVLDAFKGRTFEPLKPTMKSLPIIAIAPIVAGAAGWLLGRSSAKSAEKYFITDKNKKT